MTLSLDRIKHGLLKLMVFGPAGLSGSRLTTLEDYLKNRLLVDQIRCEGTQSEIEGAEHYASLIDFFTLGRESGERGGRERVDVMIQGLTEERLFLGDSVLEDLAARMSEIILRGDAPGLIMWEETNPL